MRFYYEALGQDPFIALPMTFHVKDGLEDPEFSRFLNHYNSNDKQNIWIIKPGENTNRGNGISVSKDI
jgi:tubulin--tyrosine ligase